MIDRKLLLELLLDVCPDVDFEKEQSLIEDGLLESLDLVAVVTAMIDTFDVEITVDDLMPENFNSMDAMAAMLEQKLK